MPMSCSQAMSLARSYIALQGAGSDAKNPAADSKPDDFSPRDRVGHGTNTSSTAAGNTATGAVTINGMAPKAYLGNYKIFGSPGVVSGGPFSLGSPDLVDAGMVSSTGITPRDAGASRSKAARERWCVSTMGDTLSRLTGPTHLATLTGDARATADRHHHHSVAHATARVRLSTVHLGGRFLVFWETLH